MMPVDHQEIYNCPDDAVKKTFYPPGFPRMYVTSGNDRVSKDNSLLRHHANVISDPVTWFDPHDIFIGPEEK